MHKNGVKVKKRTLCYQGFFRLEELQLQHRLFSGAMGPTITRELFVRPDAVCVMPYDPSTNTVVFVEQFRVGAIEKSENPWLLEIVAGLIDAGETPEQTASREAQEEVGIAFTKLVPVMRYYPSPGGSDERVYLYVGLCSTEGVHGRIMGVAEEGEDIRAHVLDFDDAMQRMDSGEIDNAASIICLQWLALNRHRL